MLLVEQRKRTPLLELRGNREENEIIWLHDALRWNKEIIGWIFLKRAA